MRLCFILFLLWASHLLLPAFASLTRGPYLQRAHPQGITVCWRTSAVNLGTVHFGTTPGALTQSVSESVPSQNHQVVITGLSPATRYFYRVESGGQTLAQGNDFFWKTPPATGSADPIRFWVLGDSGTASAGAAAVRNSFRTVAQTHPADFWLMLGDNAYGTGTDAEYQQAVFNMYTPFLQQMCLWSCLGNHDTAFSTGPELRPYDQIFVFPTAGECGGVASGSERYYSFNWGNIHFLSLDAMTSSRSVNGAQALWIQADLDANVQPWIIAFWHHPPYDKGTHDSDWESHQVEMRENIVPILESYGVDLVLCGHSHVYQRSYLIDGHYGDSSTWNASTHQKNAGTGWYPGGGAYTKAGVGATPRQGAIYAVCGNSGYNGYFQGQHPANLVNFTGMGSMVIDVNANRLEARYLVAETTPGQPPDYDDVFAIVKGVTMPPPAPVAQPPLPPGTPSGLALEAAEALLAWSDETNRESGYRIFRSEDGAYFYEVATLPADTVSYQVGNLPAGQSVQFRVQAFNAYGTADSGVLEWTQPPNPPAVTSLERWRFSYFGTISNTGVAADTADADQDGYANLVEYGLGSQPQRGHSFPTLIVQRSHGQLSLTFPRRALSDITYEVEFTSDLNSPTWSAQFQSSGGANLAGNVTVTDSGVPGQARRFARVRISR
jgi:acid phosphatase type 7